MIQNIIFDMGRVLIHWDPERLIARQGFTGEEAALLLREVFGCAEWQGLDRGRLSPEAALETILPRLPVSLHAAAEHFVRFWWKDPLWPVEGMAELVRELKALGYGIYLLSNATSRLHDYFDRIPGSECFRGKIVSADWKLLKPEHEIYETLFREYSLTPADCFFIDDNPANVEAGLVQGMQGTVFFGDMARLREELNRAGVPVRRILV